MESINIQVMPINISSNLPIINKYPFNDKEDAFIEFEIENLLKKEVIRNSSHEPGKFISPIFFREKSDGRYPVILNLKKLNESVEYRKFKMETIARILQLIRPNMYMAKLDIKDVYYDIPIYKPHQKFLKFEYKSRLFKFMLLPSKWLYRGYIQENSQNCYRSLEINKMNALQINKRNLYYRFLCSNS